MVNKICQIIADLYVMVDRPYLSITFLLQVGKLLLYKKVKYVSLGEKRHFLNISLL